MSEVTRWRSNLRAAFDAAAKGHGEAMTRRNDAQAAFVAAESVLQLFERRVWACLEMADVYDVDLGTEARKMRAAMRAAGFVQRRAVGP